MWTWRRVLRWQLETVEARNKKEDGGENSFAGRLKKKKAKLEVSRRGRREGRRGEEGERKSRAGF